MFPLFFALFMRPPSFCPVTSRNYCIVVSFPSFSSSLFFRTKGKRNGDRLEAVSSGIVGARPGQMKARTDGLTGREAASLSHCGVSWGGRISLNLNKAVNSVTQHLTLCPVNRVGSEKGEAQALRIGLNEKAPRQRGAKSCVTDPHRGLAEPELDKMKAPISE